MFKPVMNKKIYQIIIEQIQNMILSGKLKGGDKLPSERALSEQFCASRSSIREAIRSLEILGIVECRQGEGNFIKQGTGNQWLEPISVMFKLNNGSFDEILEMRQILETEAARLAAKRIEENEKLQLKEVMNQIRNAPDKASKADFDRTFHQLIADSSKNILISTVMSTITAILRNFIEEARESISLWTPDPDLLIEQHQRICDAIVNGNSTQAAEAMSIHFNMIIESRTKLTNSFKTTSK